MMLTIDGWQAEKDAVLQEGEAVMFTIDELNAILESVEPPKENTQR